MGLCPFHNEKTSSFSVNDEQGFFHCFGCGVGGNVFKFLMTIENLTFPEAVRKVAERYGISVPDEDGARAEPRKTGFEANASAARYFHRFLLESSHAQPVREYLERRGVSAEAVEEFSIGAAPVSGTGLVQWLTREGIDFGVARRLGLVGDRGGRPFDRFRNRLMFPIRDAQGRVLGFGGRLVGEAEGPKYLNSPESEVYRKSRALYGLYEARDALRTADQLVLVEGYLDVIALHEAGVSTALATCGTALTADQARIMRRYAAEVVTLFDGDSAGSRAAARSFPIFIEAGIWARSASLPAGEDPDTYVRTKGRDAVDDAVRQATPLAEAYVRHAIESAGGGDAGRTKAAAELATLLTKIRDPFERDLLARKAALWTGISEDVLRRNARPRAAAPADQRRTRPIGGAAGAEELLVRVMLGDPASIGRVDESGVINSLEEGVWKDVVGDMLECSRSGRHVDSSEVIERLPEQFRNRVAAELVEDVIGEKRETVLADCIRRLEEIARRRHNAAVLDELRRREELGLDLSPTEDLANLRPRNRSDA